MNHYAVSEVHDTLIILGETCSNSASHVLLDPRYPLVIPLSGYVMIRKGRFRHQGGKESLSNDVKVKLPKFLMEKWLTLL